MSASEPANQRVGPRPWQFSLSSFFWLQLAFAPLCVGMYLVQIPSRPPVGRELMAVMVLVYVTPALYAGILSLASIPAGSKGRAMLPWVGLHALRGLQFGVLCGVLMFGPFVSIVFWNAVRPREPQPIMIIDRHRWVNVQIGACMWVAFSFQCGLVGCVAGAMAGLIRARGRQAAPAGPTAID